MAIEWQTDSFGNMLRYVCYLAIAIGVIVQLGYEKNSKVSQMYCAYGG